MKETTLLIIIAAQLVSIAILVITVLILIYKIKKLNLIKNSDCDYEEIIGI